jgi:hypothetical protein
MVLLGEIIRLQVQTTSLKVGVRPHTRYDPAGIVPVPRLELGPGGVNGFAEDGFRLDDVHHARHPRSKSRGSNAISILFTAHYDEIRRRFGDWLYDGIAGENILVRCDRHLSETELSSGIRIESREGASIDLTQVIVADPCVEFSRYALRFPDDQRPDRTVTDAVTFLSDGMRGYYAVYEGPPISIRPGDLVYAIGSAS